MIIIYAKPQNQDLYGGEELSKLKKKEESMMRIYQGVRKMVWKESGARFLVLWSHIKPSILSTRRGQAPSKKRRFAFTKITLTLLIMYWEGAKGGEGSTSEAIEQGARDKGHLATSGEDGALLKREPQRCGRSDLKRI